MHLLRRISSSQTLIIKNNNESEKVEEEKEDLEEEGSKAGDGIQKSQTTSLLRQFLSLRSTSSAKSQKQKRHSRLSALLYLTPVSKKSSFEAAQTEQNDKICR